MSMKVIIKYYASPRQISGKASEIIDIKDDAILREIIEIISTKYPKMKKIMQHMIISVNHEYAEMDKKINDSDIISIYTPVTGG